jgi:hypothetical protein
MSTPIPEAVMEGQSLAGFLDLAAEIRLLAYKLAILRELQDSVSCNPQAVFRG